ncbi:mechanosensitive ion channel [Corynebacterium sp. zg254]|uniref:Mechanosensitive ion channel n=1 Tax=Corynebacterium zhongnanshanii TaxID=2768834 RepID=A0ABQ6VFR0_9CORY|nr:MULTISPECIES: mechanosensitive ion channel family protein [Corynebacterium]KAB3523249.1 mechanosensitive ion channel [Corynebacterium zhongnanshanii]MCR5913634.1 mechanosensitive ion channel [Corynebacterium sp. zg254]
MDFKFFLFKIWGLLIDHGIPLAALLVLAILIPRAGRLLNRILSRKLDEGEESTKASLALMGALVYVLQAVAYFAIIMLALTNVGVPPMGAAIPATVVSAAVGFGAQSVIGDFLSGFFIISERQFGVGDFVSFDGTSDSVSGTVVALTLRATKIRTSTGEVVTIPNGSAGVITNFSQEWSRAVVDMQIPLRPGETMKDLNEALKTATMKALEDTSIRRDVTGELDIWPAMSINPPATAGQPWTVTTRINVEVNPARQWAVERVIRAALLNTFWDRYEHTPDVTGLTLTESSHALPVDAADAATDTASAEDSTPSSSPSTDAEASTTEAHSDTTEGLEEVARATSDDGPGKPAFSDEEDTSRPASTRPSAEDVVQDTLSVGGRMRASTTVLLITLLILGTLALFSANPEGADAGLLNPDRWRTSTAASSEETTPSATETAPAEATAENTAGATSTQDPNAQSGTVERGTPTESNGRPNSGSDNSEREPTSNNSGGAGSTGQSQSGNNSNGTGGQDSSTGQTGQGDSQSEPIATNP